MKYTFFKGKIVPFSEAKIGIMTHAFNYGTGVFEGIRGYWNAEKNQLFILKLKEHYERLARSTNLGLKSEMKYSVDELCAATVELAKKNGYKEDIYIRPIYYKSQEKIGLGLIGIEDDFCMFISPFGAYLDITKGIRVCVSNWWRISAQSVPQGAKITGTYINSSLAKAEALEKGFDEAILLSHEKTVADGLFFCGTGAQISPIASVDDKLIKDGKVGLITKKLQTIYFKAARCDDPKYADWITPVY